MIPPPTCSIDDCDKTPIGRGFCPKHYRRWSLYGDPLGLGAGKPKAVTTCSIDGCTGTRPIVRGWCQMHYSRWKLNGDPLITVGYPSQEGESNPSWKGGKSIRNDGYVTVSHNGRHVREHRLVMERMLGRPLLPGENVHHINGIRDDNRPENLQLWVKTQPSGVHIQDILNRYGPEEEIPVGMLMC